MKTTFRDHERWKGLRDRTRANFQFYRNRNNLIREVEQLDWPPELYPRIIKEFLPLLEEDNYDKAKKLYLELNAERIYLIYKG